MGQYYYALVKAEDGTRSVYSPQDAAYRAKYGEEDFQQMVEEHYRQNSDGSTTFVPYPDKYYKLSQGLKMLEQAWYCRPFVVGVLNAIADTPARVAWVGDYANEDDDYVLNPNYSVADYSACWEDDGDTQAFDTAPDCSVKGYLVNVDKGIYLDLADVAYEAAGSGPYGNSIHPLPILTAIGNGRGGGDYWGTHMDKVGTWAMDRLQFVDDEPEGMERGESTEYAFVEKY